MILMYFGLLWRRTFDSALKEFELSQGNFFFKCQRNYEYSYPVLLFIKPKP